MFQNTHVFVDMIQVWYNRFITAIHLCKSYARYNTLEITGQIQNKSWNYELVGSML